MKDNSILSPSWQQLMSFFFWTAAIIIIYASHVFTLTSSVHTLIIHSNFNTPRADVLFFFSLVVAW